MAATVQAESLSAPRGPLGVGLVFRDRSVCEQEEARAGAALQLAANLQQVRLRLGQRQPPQDNKVSPELVAGGAASGEDPRGRRREQRATLRELGLALRRVQSTGGTATIDKDLEATARRRTVDLALRPRAGHADRARRDARQRFASAGKTTWPKLNLFAERRQ